MLSRIAVKLLKHGKNILEVSVENITPFGIWVYVDGAEFFISYKDYPMFYNVAVSKNLEVEHPSPKHLYWKTLDIDIELDALITPEKYKLISNKTWKIAMIYLYL